MKRVFLWLIVFLIGGLLFTKPVQAEQCADWICWEETCDAGTDGCPYGGWKQSCRCGDGPSCDQDPKPAGCVTCSPGEYVCNTGCCPIDPPSCFPAGTEISLPDGNTRNIEDVEVGDQVISQAEDGTRSISQVKEVESPVRLQMCQLSFENGDVLELTDEHPLLTTGGWKAIDPTNTHEEVPGLPVSTLNVGDQVITDSSQETVSAIACRSEKNQTYNLILDGASRTYFANGYLAHNKGEPSEYCGDGSCNNGETCQTCVGDCGACPVVSVDVKANGSDANIVTTRPYNITWSSVNSYENSCLLNGSQVNVAGSIYYPNPTEGWHPYEFSCTNLATRDEDSVGVTVNCDTLLADVKANGSDTDITTFNDYTISWSSANADNCTLNGGAVGLSGSQVIPALVNSYNPYDLACSTSVCSNSDNVNVEVNFCGNGSCNAFENCASCSTDCGACPTPWWQLAGGHLYSNEASGVAIASQIADDPLFCIEPSCIAALSIRDRADTTYSDGFPFTAGGSIDTNGQMITYRDPDVFAIDTTVTRLIENYTYFYGRYSLGSSPTDYFVASANDALKPTFVDQDSYFHSGDLTIQSPWAVASGESYVIFVDGSLNIEDPVAEGELITVDEGGLLAFIVSGDINIDATVGHSVLTNTAGNLEGVFIADGVITIGSNGTADKRFVGEGTFAGHGGVSLDRTYDELTNNNDRYPAETFVYRPDFIKNTPDQMKRSQMLWQETN